MGVNIWQGNIKGDFWQVLGKGAAAFGSGFGAGVLALYGPCGWVAGGMLLGSTNAWLSGEDPIQGAVIGGFSGALGGAIGSWASGFVGSVFVNGIKFSSPVLQGTITGSFGGALGGGFTGFSMSLMSGSNINEAINDGINGAKMGFVVGSVSGFGGAYAKSQKIGVNPWNGNSDKEVLIGGPQKRVDKMAKVMKIETINFNKVENWPIELDAYINDIPNPKALEFNQKWINEIIKNNYRIYDSGRPDGYSPFYHGIEAPSIKNYQNVIQTKSFFNNKLQILILCQK